VVRLVEPTVIPSMPIAAAPTFAAPPVAAPAPAVEAKSSGDSSNLVTVKSPMIGTFYRSSNPETPPFVNVGDSIKKGKTICIIEAMKLFNEIESEISGKIVKVLVENASPVEYDQPLFLVQPE
jgi:acetyl-CoA carboxylase biotin carboxyl carrier protein